MKCFIAFCLLAVAFAEPESDAQYMTYGAGLGLNPYYHHGATHYTGGLVGTASGGVVPDDTASVKAAKAQHHAAKINEYAKKQFVYAAKPVVYTKPVVTYAKPAMTYAAAPLTSMTYGMGIPSMYSTLGHSRLVKRDADADSQMYYSSGMYSPYTYGSAFSGLSGYTGYTGYPSVYSTGYGAYSYPSVYGSTYGLRYKRDADSEADSQYAYSSYSPYMTGYTGYSTGFPYSSYAGAYSYSPYSTYSGLYSGYRYY